MPDTEPDDDDCQCDEGKCFSCGELDEEAIEAGRKQRQTADPFTQFYRIKGALNAAGLHAEALALDGVLNARDTFANALGLSGHWRQIVRDRGYDAALASMKSGRNNSRSAAHLIHDLHRYERQFGFDRQSGSPAGRHAALYTILSHDGGKVLTHGSYRRKFAKL